MAILPHQHDFAVRGYRHDDRGARVADDLELGRAATGQPQPLDPDLEQPAGVGGPAVEQPRLVHPSFFLPNFLKRPSRPPCSSSCSSSAAGGCCSPPASIASVGIIWTGV